MIDFNGFDKGVIGKKLPSDKTLNNMKKGKLIELLHIAQNNYSAIRGFYSNAVDNSKCNSCYIQTRSHECNSDLIIRKKLIEDIQIIAKELNKDKQNAEPDDSDLILAVDNQLSAIWRIKGVINNQPQVQPIVRTQADRIRNMSDEELAEFLEKIASGNRSVIGTDCGNDKCESWKCTECILTYLQSEVKEV